MRSSSIPACDGKISIYYIIAEGAFSATPAFIPSARKSLQEGSFALRFPFRGISAWCNSAYLSVMLSEEGDDDASRADPAHHEQTGDGTAEAVAETDGDGTTSRPRAISRTSAARVLPGHIGCLTENQIIAVSAFQARLPDLFDEDPSSQIASSSSSAKAGVDRSDAPVAPAPKRRSFTATPPSNGAPSPTPTPELADSPTPDSLETAPPPRARRRPSARDEGSPSTSNEDARVRPRPSARVERAPSPSTEDAPVRPRPSARDEGTTPSNEGAPAPRLPSSARFLWQCDLLQPSDARDIICLKFLRAEEFNVDKSFARFAKTLHWRLENDVEHLRDAELPEHMRGHDFLHGKCKEGRPLLVSHFGTMDLEAVFGDTDLFVKYRVAIMERAVAELLPFAADKPETLYQVHDYKDCPVGISEERRIGLFLV